MSTARDLTDAFAAALARDGIWTRADSERTLTTIAAGIDGAEVDWDDGAGDYWGWVKMGDRSVALVHMRVPLVFIEADLCDTVPADVGNVVALAALAGNRLSCDPDVIGQYRFGTPISDTLDPSAFSLGQLSFATD